MIWVINKKLVLLTLQGANNEYTGQNNEGVSFGEVLEQLISDTVRHF